MIRWLTGFVCLVSMALTLPAETLLPEGTFFMVGTPDARVREFGYGEKGYSSFPERYRDPVVFHVDRDTPRAWPFIHPAHRDTWAGARAYTFTLVTELAVAPGNPLYLVIGIAGAHTTERSTVTVTVNGEALPVQQAPGGEMHLAHDPKGRGHPQHMVFEIPPGRLQPGENRLGIRLDEQSWILYDYLALRDRPEALPMEQPDLRKRLPPELKQLVFAVRQVHSDGHWYANFGYYAQSAQRKAYGGHGKLCLLNLESGEVDVLLDAPGGSVRDPQLHYDGQRILFSYRPEGGEHFHLYEMDLADRRPRQLTHGGYDDIEPVYLPDGDLMFVSSRCRRWVNCWLTQVATLHRCRPDGSGIHPVSANLEHDNTPWLLADGRILYQRWEYIDRSQVHYHHLWSMNPDGTGQMVYFGNMHPGIVMIDAKPIPGSDDIIAVFSPGHGKKEHAGVLTRVRPAQGPDHQPSAETLTSGQDYRDPYPLGNGLVVAAVHDRLVLVDESGEESTLFQLPDAWKADNVWLHEPRPLVARAPEPVIPVRTRPDAKEGTFYLSNIYEGRNLEGIEPGTIKRLAVLESLPKPVNYTGGMDPLTYGGSFTLPRVLGTVPVEADGSAYFSAPALRSLFFLALDGEGKSLKRMQSFTTVMPGEVMGCVGCHEHRTMAPDVQLSATAALAHEPNPLEPIPGIPDVFDFPRDIQPILDRHCVSCHSWEKPDGRVVLSGDRGPMFSHSYYMLSALGEVTDGRNNPVSNFEPYGIGAAASPLMQKLHGSHYDVEVPPEDVQVLRWWIEASAPYPGTYAALGNGSIGGYYENRPIETDYEWPTTLAAAEVYRERCDRCHQKDKRFAHALADENGLSFWRPNWKDPRLRLSRHVVFNLTRPEHSLVLLAPLAKESGGYGWCREGEGDVALPVFKDTGDSAYQVLLAQARAGRDRLADIKRFDMDGFYPPQPYLREMQRYGVLKQLPKPGEPVDVYALDRAYWELVAGPDAVP